MHKFLKLLTPFLPLSVQFSRSVLSDSLWSHRLQHARLPCPSPTPKACSNHVYRVSNAIQSSHPLLLPSIFPSIRVFSSELVLCIRWTKYWRFGFIISPSDKYSGLISFKIDWFDLLAVQGTLKSLLHHSSKASILWCSTFFIVQLLHPYVTIGKNIALKKKSYRSSGIPKICNIFSCSGWGFKLEH